MKDDAIDIPLNNNLAWVKIDLICKGDSSDFEAKYKQVIAINLESKFKLQKEFLK